MGVLQWLSWHKHTDKMKVSVLLLCLAVLLAVLLPETSGGRWSKRRNGRRSSGNKGRFQGNLKRKLARRGRQDEDAPEEAVNDLDEAAADDGSGLDVHTNLIDTDDYEDELQMAAATWDDASQVRVAPPQNFVAPHPEGEESKDQENVILAYDTADD